MTLGEVAQTSVEEKDVALSEGIRLRLSKAATQRSLLRQRKYTRQLPVFSNEVGAAEFLYWNAVDSGHS